MSGGFELGNSKISIEKELDYLNSNNITRSKNNHVEFTNDYYYSLLRTDFFYGCVPMKLTLCKNINKLEQTLLKENKGEFSSTLLTKEESNYFEYVMSDEYSDGLGLRNKYAHGSFNSFSSEQNKRNYVMFLMIIASLIIKIWDANEVNLSIKMAQLGLLPNQMNR